MLCSGARRYLGFDEEDHLYQQINNDPFNSQDVTLSRSYCSWKLLIRSVDYHCTFPKSFKIKRHSVLFFWQVPQKETVRRDTQ